MRKILVHKIRPMNWSGTIGNECDDYTVSTCNFLHQRPDCILQRERGNFLLDRDDKATLTPMSGG